MSDLMTEPWLRKIRQGLDLAKERGVVNAVVVDMEKLYGALKEARESEKRALDWMKERLGKELEQRKGQGEC